MGRILVGGVGHFNLSDFSAGPELSQRLEAQPWPAHVVVEDLSYGPVSICHRLREEQPGFDRWLLTGAVQRGRAPGTVTAYRWDGVQPETDAIQARVAEAVTGVVGLDNLVIVAAGLGAAPPETLIVEIEPLTEAFGDEFSAPVASALQQAMKVIRGIVLEGRPLYSAPLGG